MKHSSLRKKLLIAMLVTSVTALLLACLALLSYELYIYKNTTARNLSTLARTIAASSPALIVYDDQKDAGEILSTLKTEPDVVAACLFDKSGHLHFTYPSNAPSGLFPNTPGPDGIFFNGLHVTIFEPVMQSDGRVGTLFMHEDIHGMYNRFKVYVLVVLFVLAASASVAFLLSGFFQTRIAKPILDLASIARRISEKKDFSVRIENSATTEEIDFLNRAFNEMLEQIHNRDLSLEQARAALQKHADGLESRVAERTHSLEETTRQLYDFCYSMAHDLKAPIRAQAAYGRLLVDDFGPQLGTEGIGYARRIIDAADRQSRLVSDLLAHVSLGRSDLPIMAVDLAAAFARARSDLQVEIEHQKAILDFSGINGSVMANPASLHLVVINLLSNALKFMPPGRAPIISVHAEIANDLVKIMVRDNGIGISMQHIHKLFAIFQRLHTREEYTGTGIGLAIVKRAVERMGGSVGVESEEGKGSNFWFKLPLAK